MADIELVIKIQEEIYKASQIIDVRHKDTVQIPLEVIANSTPLPKGHGRLIDADAFISVLKDASKRQKYKELLIDDFLTVDDVFKAVIESLQNRGLAEGDAQTIIEADKGEGENKE